MTLAVAAAALAVPAAGLAGRGHGNRGDRSGDTATAGAPVPADLLAQATARPNATFAVIVTQRSSDWSSNGRWRIRRSYSTVDVVSAQLTGAQILSLRTNPDIVSIVPDPVMSVVPGGAVPVVKYVDEEMWRQSVGADRLSPSPAQPPAIAVIDSGIDSSRTADFGSRVIAHVDLVSSSDDEDHSSRDAEGHGTMVAGIAAGSSWLHRGVAPTAPLVDVHVAAHDGSVHESDVIAGIDWILQHKDQYGIRVANLSLTGNTETSFLYDPLDRAIETLWLNGVVVVAAAGNHGLPGAAVPLSSPANDPFAITVGAVDPNRTAGAADDVRAPWSAYGVTADGFAKPDLGAPGRYMLAPVPADSYLAKKAPSRVVTPGYMWMSGTSFAAPVVAGAAAQLLARHPGWTPDQVKGALMATATPLASGPTVGAGEVDVAAAAALQSPPNPNAGLEQFVSPSATTGLPEFDAQAWAGAAASGWTDSGWASSGWVSSGWTDSGWTDSGWTDSGWVD